MVSRSGFVNHDAAALVWSSATELAALLSKGAVSSRALTEAYISRIQALDGPVNAVVVRCFDAARERAAEADAALARGRVWGPLHGVPITVKENNDVKGLPTTLGNLAKINNIAASNSLVVQRLLDAGAVLLGKTNLALDLNDVQSYNDVYGRTCNPHDISRTPGGSSGGSAAALAAGFTALELGGDIGGSIRTPAHCCGIFGHKATLGAIPVTDRPSRQADIVVKGPLARSAEDLELSMRLLARAAGPAARAWSLTLPESESTKLSHFRVAVWGDDPVCPVDSHVRAAIKRVVLCLRQAGCEVDEAARPDVDSVRAFRVYKQLLASAENAGIPDVELQRLVSKSKGTVLEEQTGWIAQTYNRWHDADAERQVMRAAWEEFFTSFDVLVCPICCSIAWPHDHSGETDQPFWKIGERVIHGAEGHTTPYHDQVFWSGLTNICGNPSTVFPAGFFTSNNGTRLPVGLQIVGPEWGDLTTIAFAKALEVEAGFKFEACHDFRSML